MTIKQIMDSIYIVPVLIDHLNKPTELTSQILTENGIKRTDVEKVKGMKSLLMYHLEMVQTWQPNYPLLRKGLKEYFNENLYYIFHHLGFINKMWKVLDYGCGSGQYGLRFGQDNPDSNVFFLDRKNELGLPNFIEADFEANPGWHDPYTGCFDCVIMSELLHCKDWFGQLYLINSAIKLLNKGGYLIISENEDLCMAYRISKLKKASVYNIVTERDLTITIVGLPLTGVKKLIIEPHKIYVYERV